nr:hypothetical protein CFP56_28441 [Quercus suber]
MKSATEPIEEGPSTLQIEKIQFKPGKVLNSFKPNGREAIKKPITSNQQASVKGKMGIARNRATHSIRASTGKDDSKDDSPLSLNALGSNPHDDELGSKEKLMDSPSQVRFSTYSKTTVGFQFRGGFGKDQGVYCNGEECDGGRSEKSMLGLDEGRWRGRDFWCGSRCLRWVQRSA